MIMLEVGKTGRKGDRYEVNSLSSLRGIKKSHEFITLAPLHSSL